MLDTETAETTIDEVWISQATEHPPGAPLPRLMRRQWSHQPSWRKKAVARAWHMRAYAYVVVEAGGVPAMHETRTMMKRHIEPIDPSSPLHGALALMFDRVSAAEGVVPVFVFDSRAVGGVFLVFLPAVQS